MATTPMITNDVVRSFLAGHRLAVVGASDSKGSFGRTIAQALADHGHEVVPVHPTLGTLDGRRCYQRLADIPEPVDGVVVMVGGDAAAAVVEDAAAAGVDKVWLFKGLGGPGAASPEAIAACADHGLETVAGACPLMFLEPVAAIHRIHRSARHLHGALQKSSR
jgi:uncharacterized protein